MWTESAGVILEWRVKRRNIPSRKNSTSKGPEVGTDFDCLRKERRPMWLEQ